jgi:SWI/SNF-related matrix-associated actin-dependent regulator 1 of chromatin subfamily A
LNWEREIRIAQPGADVRIINGPDPLLPARWTVINYDLLGRKQSELKAHRWAGVILDEAHYIKNRDSAPSRVALSLLDRVEDRYLLTGTPVMNRPVELFNLLKAVEHPLGDDYVTFGRRYCGGVRTEYGWDFSGASNLDELKARTAGTILRRRKQDVLDLPPKIRGVVPVPLNASKYAAQVAQLQELALQNAAKHEGRVQWNVLLPLLSKLRHAIGKDKVKHTVSLVEDAISSGEKAIVFTCFNSVADALQAHFASAAVRLTGDTPAAERQRAVDRFQNDPGAMVFVGNILAAGTGITLTAATHVFFNDLDWVPANHLQAEDRAYRIGQTSAVNVHYISAAGTVDDAVWAVLARKFEILSQLDYTQTEQGAVVSVAEDILREFLGPKSAATDTADSADRWLRDQ